MAREGVDRVLALRFRPVRFADVVGQQHVVYVLREMVVSGRVPPAVVFAGPRGSGKTSIARILAAALNCPNRSGGDACGSCEACEAVQGTSSYVVLEVDAASHGLVEDVRQIREMVGFDTGGSWRVVLLDEAHSMSRAAFNALLKVLEEPPSRVLWVLVTTEVGKIPDTVLSRSMVFSFRRIGESEIAERLRFVCSEIGEEVEDALIAEIARKADGSLRDSLMLLDQCLRVSVRTMERYLEVFGGDEREVSEHLVWCAAGGRHGEGMSVLEEYLQRYGDVPALVEALVQVLRDLLVVGSGTASVEEVRRGARFAEVVSRVAIAEVVQAMQVVWDLARLQFVRDRAAIELAFVQLVQAFRRAEPPPAPMSYVGDGEEGLPFDEVVRIVEEERGVRR
jgi:DNA polymerase-3 subunit gamma/tau